jgi:hypothetical protein
METMKSTLKSLSGKRWACTLDLADAYLHVPFAEKDRKYLRFFVGETAYQFRVLPFGLSPAPRVFTKLGETLHKMGIHISMYLGCSPQKQVDTRTTHTVDTSVDQGPGVYCKPAEVKPNSFSGCYQGATIYLYVHQRRGINVFRRLSTYSREPQFLKPTIGTMTALIDLVPWARLHMRPIQLHLLHFLRPMDQDLEFQIPVTTHLRDHLAWWRGNVMKGQSLTPLTASLTLTTDASKSGWGGVLDGKSKGHGPRQSRTSTSMS